MNMVELNFNSLVCSNKRSRFERREERAEEDVATGRTDSSSDRAVNANQQSQGEAQWCQRQHLPTLPDQFSISVA